MLVTRVNVPILISTWNYNFGKSVHIESNWGSLLTLLAFLRRPNFPQPIMFNNGLWALTKYYLVGPEILYHLTGMLSLVLMYGLILWKLSKSVVHNIVVDLNMVIFLIVGLIMASQVISPQYLVWPAFMVPMLPPPMLKNRFWILGIGLLCLAFFLTQYVYPLHYDSFIFNFYGSGKDWLVFWVNALRNVILLLFTFNLLILIIRSRGWDKD